MTQESLKEKVEAGIPFMQKNLHELEMKHAWLLQEAEKLKTVIENQRGALSAFQQLVAPTIEEAMGGMQEPVSPPASETSPNGAAKIPV